MLLLHIVDLKKILNINIALQPFTANILTHYQEAFST